MKTILLTTTALVAFAGAAAADVGFSGGMSAGYNDVIEGGLFFTADLDMTATVDLGDNVTATASVQLFEWDEDSVDNDMDITLEFAYTGDDLSASLKMGEMGGEGASEYFYTDRSGMAMDVEEHDGDDEVRALVEFGNFGVAVGCDMDGNQDCNTSGINVGAGATFGGITIGLGYDDASSGQTAATAFSLDGTFGAFSGGLSYITTVAEDSIGVSGSFDVDDSTSVSAYFATNTVASDAYGVSVDYSADMYSVGAYFDSNNDGSTGYGADIGYTVNDQLTANAGIFSGGTAVYYVGMDYAVNDQISATISYATADAISGPEYKEGISAFISASF